MSKKLANISGIDYEYTGDEETALRRRMGKGVTDFKQEVLTEHYKDLIDKAENVLEIGPGCGRNAVYFNNLEHIKYYGFDASPTSVEYFKNGNMYWKPNMDKCYASTEIDKTILSQEYDLIFSMFTLNHIGLNSPKEVHDAASITKEVFPRLKSGGYWMSYELHMGQNQWNPDIWLEKSFDENHIDVLCNKNVDLFDTDGEKLNDQHRLIILKKK